MVFLAKGNHLCNLSREPYVAYFCKNRGFYISAHVLTITVQEQMVFQDIAMFISGCHLVLLNKY